MRRSNEIRCHFRRRGSATSDSGQTLLEVLAATTIMTVALVPALRLTRDSLCVGRQIESANLLATLCTSKLEEHLIRTATIWDSSLDTGTFPIHPGFRYRVEKTEQSVGAGLMKITVVVWEDSDGNGVWSRDEARCVFGTNLAHNVVNRLETLGG